MHANNIVGYHKYDSIIGADKNDIPIHLTNSQLKVQLEPVNVASIRGHSNSSEMEERERRHLHTGMEVWGQ